MLVELPLLLPGLVIAFLLVFILSFGEVGAGLSVMPPGGETISIRIFNYLHYGASEEVSGISLLVFLFMVFLFLMHKCVRYFWFDKLKAND